jgi:uncharacterized protein YprB with RNaseH-like and TPR domain
MIDGTFSFVRGVGPAREKELWRAGIRRWDDFPETGTVLSPKLDDAIRAGISVARGHLAAGRLEALWAMLPAREAWRFIPALEGEACCLDIETTFDGRVTVIGLYDPARGPRVYVRGLDLGDFVREPPARAYFTFNGAGFDFPVLERTFPGWRMQGLHVDLRNVTARLGERGGLKAIEARWGLARPDHLTGLGGADAPLLWGRFAQGRDVAALRRLVDYNLCDVVQLRSVAQLACARLSERVGRPWAAPRPFLRGDVLWDVTRAVDAVVARAPGITPEAFHAEERRVLRG